MARTFLKILCFSFFLALLVACVPGGGSPGGGFGGGIGDNAAAPSQSELGQDTAPNTPIDCPDDWKDEEGVCHEPVGDFKTPEGDQGGDEDDDDNDEDEGINDYQS